MNLDPHLNSSLAAKTTMKMSEKVKIQNEMKNEQKMLILPLKLLYINELLLTLPRKHYD